MAKPAMRRHCLRIECAARARAHLSAGLERAILIKISPKLIEKSFRARHGGELRPQVIEQRPLSFSAAQLHKELLHHELIEHIIGPLSETSDGKMVIGYDFEDQTIPG